MNKKKEICGKYSKREMRVKEDKKSGKRLFREIEKKICKKK